MNKLKCLLLASGIAAASFGSVSAETYRFSQWQSDNESTVVINRKFIEDVAKATNGAITFELISGGVLMPPRGHLQGIGDGVAQAGQATGGYTPSELPLTNALGGFGFVENNPIAIGAAMADWIIHDPAGHKEWSDHNVVPLAGFSTPTYPIICNTAQPITELAQMQGLKVRSVGLIGALVQSLGGVPVNIPAPEIYQALQNGQIDCASILAPWLNIDNKLEEVSKSSTLMNWTPSYISPMQLYNKDFWKSLSNENRAVLIENAARAQARLQIYYDEQNQKALNDAQSRGHVVVEPGESIKAAVKAWVDAGVGDMAGIAKSSFGVQDPEALFASFEPYVKKWGDLVRGMKNPLDEEELTKLFLDNMYKDVDPATYGMN